jgi:hypothetical protein
MFIQSFCTRIKEVCCVKYANGQIPQFDVKGISRFDVGWDIVTS